MQGRVMAQVMADSRHDHPRRVLPIAQLSSVLVASRFSSSGAFSISSDGRAVPRRSVSQSWRDKTRSRHAAQGLSGQMQRWIGRFSQLYRLHRTPRRVQPTRAGHCGHIVEWNG
ncbi:hypothetical protein C9J85_08930 [Haloferax sp. wsp5]|nr:hypothetical protein C9J85_08930 [Haloferax sp. wsp5]